MKIKSVGLHGQKNDLTTLYKSRNSMRNKEQLLNNGDLCRFDINTGIFVE